MKNQFKSSKKLKERQLFLMLPLLTLPFITLLFWALGGGKGQEDLASSQVQTGLLLDLPMATLSEDPSLTKLDFYNQANADSTKLWEMIKNDPDYRNPNLKTNLEASNTGVLNTSLSSHVRNNDSHEEKIYQKLAELDRELNYKAKPAFSPSDAVISSGLDKGNNVHSADIDRLEQLMKTMGDSVKEDGEMKQIQKVLETILDIQHPERIQQRSVENIGTTKVIGYPVKALSEEVSVSLLSPAVELIPMVNGFYSLTDTGVGENAHLAIEAVIHETQMLVNGSTVKLRLINDVTINGVNIPKDHFLYGIAQLTGERLGIRVKSIQYNHTLLPVDLTVFDLDGMAGIYIPGSSTSEVAKESADRSLQNIGLGSIDSSWGAQATVAGVQAAKSLLSKKVKQVKVTVKAGYQVLLWDEKQG